MKSLYVIESEYLRIAEALVNDELTVELESQIAINQNELQAKGLAYGHMIKEMQYDMDIIDVEIARLEAIRNSRNNALERLKSNLKGAMELYGILELKSPTMKVSFRKSESVNIIDIDALPKEYITVKTTEMPDKTAIKRAIKEGTEITGAELVINQNLQIR